jgi:hypothetical protein
MPSPTYFYSIPLPTPDGLDPKRFRVTIGVDRADGKALTAEDCAQIEKVYQAELEAEAEAAPKAAPAKTAKASTKSKTKRAAPARKTSAARVAKPSKAKPGKRSTRAAE